MSPDRQETPTILVADDDEDILMLVRHRLERRGYAVIDAHDGTEALTLAIERHPTRQSSTG